MVELLIKLRRFKSIESLEQVAERMYEKALAQSTAEAATVLAAVDHRRAEIASGRIWDAGKVPTYVWALVD
ncbi:Hha/YmoA family nucleoid-associated regulatory protein [Aeromonas veronii]|uniref:Hha/YmoA family nucleoid-associated regulatory protein n=1 Tax=Aeromonas veronii TaxID=654 RepID=UPI001F1D20D5|nr:Hha/YmoA family nucleoid-associated regulatory protein [Aeromonas veronii]MCF5866719.1 hypothetical protein [Aeromonas veronii]